MRISQHIFTSLAVGAISLVVTACGGSGSGGTVSSSSSSPIQQSSSSSLDSDSSQSVSSESSSSSSESDNRAILDQLVYLKGLNSPMAGCSERAWAGIADAYASSQVLLIDSLNGVELAALWRANAGVPEVELLDPSALSTEWFSAYNFGDFRGLKTLGFNVGQWWSEVDALGDNWWQTPMTALLHEGFHLFGQDGWHYTPGSRDQTYPIDWQPRYLRAELLKALYGAIITNGDLSAAAYWYERYLAEHTDEAARLSYIDRIEGSTEYVQYVMTAIAELGCDATDEAIMSNLRENLNTPSFVLRGASESYELGVVAGYLLSQKAVPDWQQRVEDGETMHGILLDETVAEPQPEDVVWMEQIQAAADYETQRIGELIADDISALQDTDYYRLVTDAVSYLGAATSQGSFTLTNVEGFDTVIVNNSGVVLHGSEINVWEAGVFKPISHPCGTQFRVPQVIAIKKNDMSLNGLLASAATEHLAFNAVPVQIKEYGGFEWVCPGI